MSDIEHWDEPILGIDFGTTNSGAAYFTSDSDSVSSVPFGRNLITESTVLIRSVDSGWKAFVGDDAEVQSLSRRHPQALFSNIKSYLGEPRQAREIFRARYRSLVEGAGELDPEDITSILFRYIRKAASAYANDSRKGNANVRTEEKLDFERAVIGIPAAVGNPFRRALKLSGVLAGFRDVHLVPEPVAGCRDYIDTNRIELEKNERILVVDIGAGTTDFTIVHKNDEGTLSIELTDGDNRLGGNRIDQSLFLKLQNEHPDLEIAKTTQNLRDLRGFKEKVNNICNKTGIEDAHALRSPLFVELRDGTRREIEVQGTWALNACLMTIDIIRDRISRFLNDLARATSSGLSKRIVHVLLLGGGSEMYALRAIVRKIQERHPGCFALRESVNSHDPIFGVARGLARIAADWRQGVFEESRSFFYVPKLPMDTGLAVISKKNFPRYGDMIYHHSVHLRKHSKSGESSPHCYMVHAQSYERVISSVRLTFLMGGSIYIPEEVNNRDLLSEYQSDCRCIGIHDYRLSPPRLGMHVKLDIWFSLNKDGEVAAHIRDMGFESLHEEHKKKDPEPMEKAEVVPLTFGALSPDEMKAKRERNQRINVLIEGGGG